MGEKGIIAFISNSSFIDAKVFDGFRKIVTKEFQEIWIVNLKGNARTSGKRRKAEGGNVFDDKIRVGIAVYFFVKNPALNGCKIHYLTLDDFLPAIEKRRWLKNHSLQKLAKTGEFESIRPNEQGLWLNQPTEDWSDYLAIASKEAKAGKSNEAIFKLHSLGVNTARDEWIYDFSQQQLSNKVNGFFDLYSSEQIRWQSSDKQKDIETFVNRDIKWHTELTAHLVKGTQLVYQQERIVKSCYRPFVNKFLYYRHYVKTVKQKK